jgi:hypothetical protein
MSYNRRALYMFSTFSFMVALPFMSKGEALVAAALATTVASLTPGSTAMVQSIDRAVLGD